MNERERMEAEIADLDREIAHMRLLEEIVELEHSTRVVPMASDPDHCGLCAEVYWRLKSLRKVDA